MAELLGVVFVVLLVVFGKGRGISQSDAKVHETEDDPVLDPSMIGSGVNIFDESIDDLFRK